MSVIGSRPFIDEERRNLPNDRLLVKLNLSCYWQTDGKNDLSLREQIELDRRYGYERSMIVDMEIMVKTMAMAVVGENK